MKSSASPVRRSHVRPLLALVVLVGLASACGGDMREGSPPEAAQPDFSQPGPGLIDLPLATLPGFTASGMVTLEAVGDSIVADVVAETHLGAGEFGIHIHEGTCLEGGRVVVALTSVATGESGEGTSQSVFAAERLIPGGTYFVQLHQPDGVPIACADLAPFHL